MILRESMEQAVRCANCGVAASVLARDGCAAIQVELSVPMPVKIAVGTRWGSEFLQTVQ